MLKSSGGTPRLLGNDAGMPAKCWCVGTGSNRRLPGLQPRALPLSYPRIAPTEMSAEMVRPEGFEPPTYAVSRRRSTAELRTRNWCPAINRLTEQGHALSHKAGGRTHHACAFSELRKWSG